MKHLILKSYVKLQVLAATELRKEEGQDLIEYALVVALIAFAAVAGMSGVATNISAAFSSIGSKLTSSIG